MSSEPDVVEFGPASAPAPRRASPRWHTVATSPRLTTALIVLGGAAALASLLSEWQRIDTPGSTPSDSYFLGIPDLVSSVWNVPVGPVYLGGLLLLAPTIALALLGPPVSRAAARVAGMSGAAALFTVLAAAAGSMGDLRQTPQLWAIEPELLERFTVQLGRGLWAALVGISLLGLALLTAHRRDPASPVARPAGGVGEEPDDQEDRDMELTVSTAAPFIRRP
ncbi:hypothetical protein ACFQY4_45355 [Catellatospora bangladeshensis]|uniref:Uncharacterized protein n=1 Tax=Catellatospora bangladeshensis TaxID=310355 RepID=A0A8J3NLV5_9ACTN|nr:hypothetical protein [Catellatospora bangladeshensis]GIF84476.1 hypothetical protein Cba03nite_58250 [Catellatospora bangladeshensis]